MYELLLLATIPPIVILYISISYDISNANKENVFLAFFVGFASALPIVWIQEYLLINIFEITIIEAFSSYPFISSFIIAGCVEEVVKFLCFSFFILLFNLRTKGDCCSCSNNSINIFFCDLEILVIFNQIIWIIVLCFVYTLSILCFEYKE